MFMLQPVPFARARMSWFVSSFTFQEEIPVAVGHWQARPSSEGRGEVRVYEVSHFAYELYNLKDTCPSHPLTATLMCDRGRLGV